MKSPASAPTALGKRIRERALSYPQTTEDFPWGESAFKVKGKTFIFMRDGEEGVSLSVKLDRGREFALSLPRSEPTHYGLGAKGWVTLRPTAKTKPAVLFDLIDESYRLVAPRRVLQELDRK